MMLRMFVGIVATRSPGAARQRGRSKQLDPCDVDQAEKNLDGTSAPECKESDNSAPDLSGHNLSVDQCGLAANPWI